VYKRKAEDLVRVGGSSVVKYRGYTNSRRKCYPIPGDRIAQKHPENHDLNRDMDIC